MTQIFIQWIGHLLVKNQRFLSMLGNCNNLLYIFAISDILRTDNYCLIIFVREYSLKRYLMLVK